MPQPTPGDVHVNRPLTNISVAYMQAESSFIARRVFQPVPVMKQSDRYFTFDREFFFRDTMKKRAPGTESAGGGWEIDSTPTYYCDVWALHKDIDDQTRANADNPLNMDRTTTIYLTQQRLIRMEREFVTNYMGTSKWSTDVTGVSGTPSTGQVKQWNDAASTPIEDVKAYCTAVQKLTGMRPNVLTLGQEVWDKLSTHSDILDRIKYSGGVGNATPAVASKQAVASMMEIDEILVSGAVVNTAAEGATAAFDFIVAKTALLSYRPAAPGLETPAAGYTFEWSAFNGANEGQRMKSFRMEHLESDRLEIQASFDMKLVSAPLGVFFASLVA